MFYRGRVVLHLQNCLEGTKLRKQNIFEMSNSSLTKNDPSILDTTTVVFVVVVLSGAMDNSMKSNAVYLDDDEYELFCDLQPECLGDGASEQSALEGIFGAVYLQANPTAVHRDDVTNALELPVQRLVLGQHDGANFGHQPSDVCKVDDEGAKQPPLAAVGTSKNNTPTSYSYS